MQEKCVDIKQSVWYSKHMNQTRLPIRQAVLNSSLVYLKTDPLIRHPTAYKKGYRAGNTSACRLSLWARSSDGRAPGF